MSKTIKLALSKITVYQTLSDIYYKCIKNINKESVISFILVNK